jgi:hypothetical protein
MGQTRQVARPTTLKYMTRHNTIDVVLVPTRHDGRAVSRPRSRHTIRKGQPSKHHYCPSKHRPTTAHDSYIYIQRNPNLPQPSHLQSHNRRPSPLLPPLQPPCLLRPSVVGTAMRPTSAAIAGVATRLTRAAVVGCGHEGSPSPANNHDFFLCMDLVICGEFSILDICT